MLTENLTQSHSSDRNLLISEASVSPGVVHLFVVVPTAFFNISSFLPGFLHLIPCLGNNSVSSVLILLMVSFPKINLAFYQILCLCPLELISIVWEWANCAWGVHLSKETLMLSYFFWEYLTTCICECFSFFSSLLEAGSPQLFPSISNCGNLKNGIILWQKNPIIS